MAVAGDIGLNDSKIYHQAIIDTGDMAAIIDQKYTCLFVSRLFTHYLGMKKTDIIGHTIPEVIGEESFTKKLKPYIDRSLQGKRTVFELFLPDPKLEKRRFYLKCYPAQEDDIRMVIILAMDITTLKQREQSMRSEQRIYRTVLKKATDILLVMDPDGIIISCSRYLDRQTGLSSQDVIGKSVQRVLTQQSYETVIKHLDEWKSHQARNRCWEVDVVSRDGQVLPFEVHSNPVYEYSKLKWVVVIARDISERKYLEEKTRSSYRDLENKLEVATRESQLMLQKIKEEFNQLSSRILEDQERERNAIGRELHDEMGGYLTILGIYMGKMAKDPGNKAWQEQFTQSFDEMVNYIRSLSHSLYPVMLEKGDLLAALISYFNNYQRRIGVKVTFKYRGLNRRLPTHIEAVTYRIIQEALTNVAKHAAAQSVKVTVSRVKDNLKILVEDDGRGFDVTKMKTEGAYGITGMKNRALFAGGKLIINSSPGHGTSVICTLPVTESTEVRLPGLTINE